LYRTGTRHRLTREAEESGSVIGYWVIENREQIGDRVIGATRVPVYLCSLAHAYRLDHHNYIPKYAKKLLVTEEYEVLHYPNGTSDVGRGSLIFDKSPSYLNTKIFPNVAK
jgi:hypothetical protein